MMKKPEPDLQAFFMILSFFFLFLWFLFKGLFRLSDVTLFKTV